MKDIPPIFRASYDTAKQKVTFAIFHIILWSVALVVMVVFIMTHTEYWYFKLLLVAVMAGQIYSGVNGYKEEKKKLNDVVSLINKGNEKDGQA